MYIAYLPGGALLAGLGARTSILVGVDSLFKLSFGILASPGHWSHYGDMCGVPSRCPAQMRGEGSGGFF